MDQMPFPPLLGRDGKGNAAEKSQKVTMAKRH
jgi:hypothetical protein